jgi:hypothetical protein
MVDCFWCVCVCFLLCVCFFLLFSRQRLANLQKNRCMGANLPSHFNLLEPAGFVAGEVWLEASVYSTTENRYVRVKIRYITSLFSKYC